MEGDAHRQAGLKPGREPFWVYVPPHATIHDVSAETGLEPRAPGAPRPPQTGSKRETVGIALATMLNDVAGRLLEGREDALSTVAALAKAFTSAYVRANGRLLARGDLRNIAAAILVAAIHAHAVPVGLNEVAEAFGLAMEELHHAVTRGMKALAKLGIGLPRSTPSTRIARTIALARRYASELGLPHPAIHLAGELAAVIARLNGDRRDYPESIARFAAYASARLTGRSPGKARATGVLKVSDQRLYKAGRAFSIAAVYPPRGSPGKPVKVRLGGSWTRLYCGNCGALLLDRSGRDKYKPITVPGVCPRCLAILDKSRPAVAISRIEANAEVVLEPTQPGEPPRVVPVGV